MGFRLFKSILSNFPQKIRKVTCRSKFLRFDHTLQESPKNLAGCGVGTRGLMLYRAMPVDFPSAVEYWHKNAVLMRFFAMCAADSANKTPLKTLPLLPRIQRVYAHRVQSAHRTPLAAGSSSKFAPKMLSKRACDINGASARKTKRHFGQFKHQRP